MIFHLCREPVTHKTEGFPMAYYSVDETHPRYLMMHHWHPEAELLILRRGTMTLTLEDRTMELREGQFALIPSGEVHSGVPEKAWYECVVFDGRGLTDILQGSTKERVNQILSTPLLVGGTEELSALTNALSQRKTGYQTAALSALFALLTKLVQTVPAAPLPQRRKSRLIPFEKAVLYLREHYGEPITLQDISSAAGLSEKYFGEYFKNITGLPPIRYLNEYRAERAAEQLKRTEKPVTEIALECGFNDLSYFIKTFRKHYGISPGNYRKHQE